MALLAVPIQHIHIVPETGQFFLEAAYAFVLLSVYVGTDVLVPYVLNFLDVEGLIAVAENTPGSLPIGVAGGKAGLVLALVQGFELAQQIAVVKAARNPERSGWSRKSKSISRNRSHTSVHRCRKSGL